MKPDRRLLSCAAFCRLDVLISAVPQAVEFCKAITFRLTAQSHLTFNAASGDKLVDLASDVAYNTAKALAAMGALVGLRDESSTMRSCHAGSGGRHRWFQRGIVDKTIHLLQQQHSEFQVAQRLVKLHSLESWATLSSSGCSRAALIVQNLAVHQRYVQCIPVSGHPGDINNVTLPPH